MGNNDGEEDNAEPAVDEGRCSNAESACAGADEDNGDRAEGQAELCGDASEGVDIRCDAGDASKEERGVMLGGGRGRKGA
jgi:hypothetical protein